jgi:hypothetical protein
MSNHSEQDKNMQHLQTETFRTLILVNLASDAFCIDIVSGVSVSESLDCHMPKV